jgi:hypothetical protein
MERVLWVKVRPVGVGDPAAPTAGDKKETGVPVRGLVKVGLRTLGLPEGRETDAEEQHEPCLV